MSPLETQVCDKPYSAVINAINELRYMVENAKKFIETNTDTLELFMNLDENYNHNLHMAQYNKKKRIRNKYIQKLLKNDF